MAERTVREEVDLAHEIIFSMECLDSKVTSFSDLSWELSYIRKELTSRKITFSHEELIDALNRLIQEGRIKIGLVPTNPQTLGSESPPYYPAYYVYLLRLKAD